MPCAATATAPTRMLSSFAFSPDAVTLPSTVSDVPVTGILFGNISAPAAGRGFGADYQSYTALTDADIKELTVSLDALSEQVSKVPGVVEAT